MKAVLYNKSSSPDFLTLRELEPPVPQDHEVLIRVHAVSLNLRENNDQQRRGAGRSTA